MFDWSHVSLIFTDVIEVMIGHMPRIDSRNEKTVTSLMNAATKEKTENILQKHLMILFPLNPTLINQSAHVRQNWIVRLGLKPLMIETGFKVKDTD